MTKLASIRSCCFLRGPGVGEDVGHFPGAGVGGGVCSDSPPIILSWSCKPALVRSACGHGFVGMSHLVRAIRRFLGQCLRELIAAGTVTSTYMQI